MYICFQAANLKIIMEIERIEKYRINISDNNSKSLKLTNDQMMVCSSVLFIESNIY